jgi:rsbT co-antagonist protein RsbR
MAVRLLGAETILTGIGASAAKTIVQLGVDLSVLHTCGRLTEGLDLALTLLADRAAPG